MSFQSRYDPTVSAATAELRDALDQLIMACDLMVQQGIAKDRAEAYHRLASGEKITVSAKVDTSEWRGLYGTSE